MVGDGEALKRGSVINGRHVAGHMAHQFLNKQLSQKEKNQIQKHTGHMGQQFLNVAHIKHITQKVPQNSSSSL